VGATLSSISFSLAFSTILPFASTLFAIIFFPYRIAI